MARKQLIELLHQGFGRALEMHARRGRGNTPQEEIQGSAHVSVVVIVRQTGLEQAVQGLSMLHAELAKSLEKVGVERIEPTVGDAFDPGVHEAVMKQPVDGVAPGAISMAFQSGYRLGDSVLRPAKVAVQPTE